jgi:hypothetical protein
VPVSGQLGNQMFQYASLLGIAYRNRRQPFYSTATRLRAFQASYIASRSDQG